MSFEKAIILIEKVTNPPKANVGGRQAGKKIHRKELKQKHQMGIYMIKIIVYTYCLIICDNENGIPQGN